jgi:DHA2 family methylenomycin A resistance protein-like MFS transporter
VFNTFRQVGGAVAIAVLGSLIASSKTFLPGLCASLVIAAILLFITALASLRVPTQQTAS